MSKFSCISYSNVVHVCRIMRQREYWLEHEERKIICASGHSTMRRWSSPFPGRWLAPSPRVAMLACIYIGPLIDIFFFCQPSRRTSKCYYFFLRVRAVASSVLFSPLLDLQVIWDFMCQQTLEDSVYKNLSATSCRNLC